MKKDKIQAILDSAHKEISFYIRNSSDKELNESLLIDFLHSFANKLIQQKLLNSEEISFNLDNISFNEEYKLLAIDSIDSYTNTTQSFEKITDQQNDFLLSEQFKTMNVSLIEEHIQQMQSSIKDEIITANETISELLAKVENLEKSSQIDPLTKVYNRRSMDQYFENLEKIDLNQHKKESDIHIIMIDIDDFKKVNDSYGHLVGDKVLIFLASLLQKTLRDGDKIFRYGGEEFVLVLNRVDNATCKKIIERILHLVRTNKLTYQSNRIAITLSIGVTTFEENDTALEVLQRADEALYEAKRAGKDQLIKK